MKYCLRFLKNSYRYLSSESSLTFKNINHFGAVDVKCPGLSTIIRPINPHEVPNGDMAFVGFIDDKTGARITDTCLLNDIIHTGYCDKTHLLKIYQHDSSQCFNNKLLIQVPHNYNLNVESYNVSIEETEGSSMKIFSHGDCLLGKIKSGIVDIVSYGNLACKNLLGNGQVHAKKNCSFQKIQSKCLNITSPGNIKISSCYSPEIKCSSENGNIDIGSLHGSSKIETLSGDISIATLDGDLIAKTDSGDIEITIEQCGKVFAETREGNIDVGLGEKVSAFIEGTAVEIDVPEDLLFDGMKRVLSTGTQLFEGKLGTANGTINVMTSNGTVGFSRKNWFSKFNFIDLD